MTKTKNVDFKVIFEDRIGASIKDTSIYLPQNEPIETNEIYLLIAVALLMEKPVKDDEFFTVFKSACESIFKSKYTNENINNIIDRYFKYAENNEIKIKEEQS